jgi:hypothetical protein
MTVVRMPVRGQWAWDVRGEGRAARISAHTEAGLVNLSVWRHDVCVGTVRLLPEEVANLVTGLTEGLAELARRPDATTRGAAADAQRLLEMEHRLTRLESRNDGPIRLRAAVERVRGTVRSWRATAPRRPSPRMSRAR